MHLLEWDGRPPHSTWTKLRKDQEVHSTFPRPVEHGFSSLDSSRPRRGVPGHLSQGRELGCSPPPSQGRARGLLAAPRSSTVCSSTTSPLITLLDQRHHAVRRPGLQQEEVVEEIHRRRSFLHFMDQHPAQEITKDRGYLQQDNLRSKTFPNSGPTVTANCLGHRLHFTASPSLALFRPPAETSSDPLPHSRTSLPTTSTVLSTCSLSGRWWTNCISPLSDDPMAFLRFVKSFKPSTS